MKASRDTLPDTLSPAEIAAAGLPRLWKHQWPFVWRNADRECPACSEPIKKNTWVTTVAPGDGGLVIAHLRHYVQKKSQSAD